MLELIVEFAVQLEPLGKILAFIAAAYSAGWAAIRVIKYLLSVIKSTNKTVIDFLDLIPELETMTKQFKPNGGQSLFDILKRLENNLSHTDQKIKVIASCMGIAAFESDKDGGYIFVSKQWGDLTGMSFTESLGNGWLNIIEDDSREDIFLEWKASIEQNREFHCVTKLNSGKEVSIVAWPIRNLDGSVEKFFGIAI
jgi:PAS domain-containing protein